MSLISNVEQEVNEIRLKIYEETKDLTPEQYKKRLDEMTMATARKYGFTVISSTKDDLRLQNR
ncbi:MAG: hypothetical protein LBP21_09160 [Synergistaceae bacterium]|jgi:hypothetical protein|nr:hypothetical protein [Synergistaceae bacterium]